MNILGDPGADSGGGGNLNTGEKKKKLLKKVKFKCGSPWGRLLTGPVPHSFTVFFLFFSDGNYFWFNSHNKCQSFGRSEIVLFSVKLASFKFGFFSDHVPEMLILNRFVMTLENKFHPSVWNFTVKSLCRVNK